MDALAIELDNGHRTAISNYEVVSQERGHPDGNVIYAVINDLRIMVAVKRECRRMARWIYQTSEAPFSVSWPVTSLGISA